MIIIYRGLYQNSFLGIAEEEPFDDSYLAECLLVDQFLGYEQSFRDQVCKCKDESLLSLSDRQQEDSILEEEVHLANYLLEQMYQEEFHVFIISDLNSNSKLQLQELNSMLLKRYTLMPYNL